MQETRNNIMFRKVRSYNGRNITTTDTEFEAEKARIEALRNKREQISEHRRVVFYGSSEEKSRLQSEIGMDAQLQMHIKGLKDREEREKSKKEYQVMEEHRRMLIEMEKEREREKKEKLRQMQEDNRIAALVKKCEWMEKKVTEDMKDRDAIRENLEKYQPNVF
jgi:hypothetical protein